MSFIVAWLVVVGVLGGGTGLAALAIMWGDVGVWVYDKLVERGTLADDIESWIFNKMWNTFGGFIVAFLFSLCAAAVLVDATKETSSVDNVPDKVIEYPVE